MFHGVFRKRSQESTRLRPGLRKRPRTGPRRGLQTTWITKNPRNMPRICETAQEIDLAQFHSKLSGCSILASSIASLQYRHELTPSFFFSSLWKAGGTRTAGLFSCLQIIGHRTGSTSSEDAEKMVFLAIPPSTQHTQNASSCHPCSFNLNTARMQHTNVPPLQYQSQSST